mgnify:CR=1 FL=1
MTDENHHRLTDLEIRLAHHEHMVEEMSEVMARQQDEINRLSLQMRTLIGRLRELETGPAASPQDDRPPPHY